MTGSDGHRGATVAELAVALRSGTATAGTLAAAALDRAERLGRRFGAVASLTTGRAVTEAAAADARLAAGDPAPLLGIPYGAKDIIAARSAPTSWGVTSLVARVTDSDAVVVDRLHRHGGVLVAKLVTTSLAGGGGVSRPGISAHGQPRNPWSPERYAGGSSSGSAIAVALGIVPYALGSETGGSVIQPAAFCGVTGYRPTWGLIPRTGVMRLSSMLDKVGVLARGADDCATVAAALADADLGDDDGPVVLGIAGDELSTVAAPMRAAAKRGLDTLSLLASRVRAAEVAPSVGYGAAIELLVAVDAHRELRSLIDDPATVLADPGQLERLRAAADIPASSHAEALAVGERARDEFARVFAEVDVLAGVSIAAQPQPRAEPRRPRGSASVADRLLAAANLAGLPGVAVPCGLDDDGLPVSLHLVGPPGADARVLGLASRFQAETSFHRLVPPAADLLDGHDGPR